MENNQESSIINANQQIAIPQRQTPEVYKFTPDEVRVIKQCNSESFYQRSLPLSTLLGIGTYLGVQSGYLRGNPRYGPTPKICIAVIAGYFIGKLSYQQKCAEKIMALPNSRLGEVLRQRKRQGINEPISLEPGFSTGFASEPIRPNETIAPQQSYLDIDSDRPYVSQYDHPLQEDSSYDLSTIPVPPAGAPTTTYDELRRKNREDFELQRNRPVRIPGELEAAPQVIRARTPPEPAMRTSPKNKYGDEWEN